MMDLKKNAKTIVVGVDDPIRSGYAAALTFAVREAQLHHAGITLVHGCLPRFGLAPINQHTGEEYLQRGQELLLQAEHDVHRMDVNIPVETSCSFDVGIDTLLDMSESAQLIVLQRRHLSKLHRLSAGSTTSTLAARSACPVVITHADAPEQATGVVVGVDDSGHSRAALEMAFQEASWRKTPLTVVHAWQVVYDAPYYGYIPPDPGDRRVAREEAECLLAEAIAGQSERFSDVAVHRRVVEGPPTDVLLKESEGAQLLVVARHSNLPVGSLALGSITRSLIEKSATPVMVSVATRPVRHRQKSASGASGTKVPTSRDHLP